MAEGGRAWKEERWNGKREPSHFLLLWEWHHFLYGVESSWRGCFECEMSSVGTHVQTRGSQLALLLGKVVELLDFLGVESCWRKWITRIRLRGFYSPTPLPVHFLLCDPGCHVTNEPLAADTRPSPSAAQSSMPWRPVSLWNCKPKDSLFLLSCWGLLLQHQE